MRENRTYGSEGGEANAFPTPIRDVDIGASDEAPVCIPGSGLRPAPE